MWTFLSILAIGALAVSFWLRKNAIWGGATIGLFIGLAIALFKGFHFYIFQRAIIIGALVGFGAEALGLLADYLKSKND